MTARSGTSTSTTLPPAKLLVQRAGRPVSAPSSCLVARRNSRHNENHRENECPGAGPGLFLFPLDSRIPREDNPPDSPLRRAVLSTRSAHPLRRNGPVLGTTNP